MTGKSVVRRSLSVFILVLALFAAVPVFGATERNVTLKFKSSSYWVKKSINVGNKIRLNLSYNDIILLNENVTFKSSKPTVAYVSKTGLITAKKAGSATVTATFNGRRAGLKITVSGSSNNGNNGKVSSLRTQIVNYANKFVGVLPYVYGGNSLESGTDCSGFINLIMAHFGISTARTASAFQSMSNISYSDLLPGDLVCYKNGGHVALYVGNDTIIHAKGSNYGTVKESMWYGTPTGYVRIIK
jgi:cell wall-associated NlpC family hydrolase